MPQRKFHISAEGVCQVLKHESQCCSSMMIFADTNVIYILIIHRGVYSLSEFHEPVGHADLLAGMICSWKKCIFYEPK